MTSSPHPLSIETVSELSLRGSERTEAISQHNGNMEIATLTLVARNDEEAITAQSHRGKGDEGMKVIFRNFTKA
jgi:hypothetical protein